MLSLAWRGCPPPPIFTPPRCLLSFSFLELPALEPLLAHKSIPAETWRRRCLQLSSNLSLTKAGYTSGARTKDLLFLHPFHPATKVLSLKPRRVPNLDSMGGTCTMAP